MTCPQKTGRSYSVDKTTRSMEESIGFGAQVDGGQILQRRWSVNEENIGSVF
jgi:hypothetical protein